MLAPAFDRSRGVSFVDYLRSQLRWKLRNYLRSERRRAGFGRSQPLEEVEIGSGQFDPARMSGLDLRSAIRRLSPRQRAVLAAKYLEDKRTGEIAASLGISRQSVAGLLRRARRTLQDTLSDEPNSGGSQPSSTTDHR